MYKKQLQIAKVSTHGRVYLGDRTMNRLKLNVGDHIQIVDEGGTLRISKIEA